MFLPIVIGIVVVGVTILCRRKPRNLETSNLRISSGSSGSSLQSETGKIQFLFDHTCIKDILNNNNNENFGVNVTVQLH